MSEHTDRRIAKLRKIPLYANTETHPDDYVQEVMEGSLNAFLEHTLRQTDLGETIDAIIIDLAKSRINKMGLEGTASTGEGGVSQSWEIEPFLMTRMARFKLMQGMKGGLCGTGGGSAAVSWKDILGDPGDNELLVAFLQLLLGGVGTPGAGLPVGIYELDHVPDQTEGEKWDVAFTPYGIYQRKEVMSRTPVFDSGSEPCELMDFLNAPWVPGDDTRPYYGDMPYDYFVRDEEYNGKTPAITAGDGWGFVLDADVIGMPAAMILSTVHDPNFYKLPSTPFTVMGVAAPFNGQTVNVNGWMFADHHESRWKLISPYHVDPATGIPYLGEYLPHIGDKNELITRGALNKAIEDYETAVSGQYVSYKVAINNTLGDAIVPIGANQNDLNNGSFYASVSASPKTYYIAKYDNVAKLKSKGMDGQDAYVATVNDLPTGGGVNVLQATGQSTADSMSQKAISDALSGKIDYPTSTSSFSDGSYVFGFAGIPGASTNRRAVRATSNPPGNASGQVPIYNSNSKLVSKDRSSVNAEVATVNDIPPAPPASGTYKLVSVDGVMSWVLDG